MTNKDKYTTKQKILDISIDMFASLGFKEVSMRRIASEVGIKASSLYKHYKSKEDILESIFDVFRDKLKQTEHMVPDFDSPEEYFSLSYKLFKQVMGQPSVLKIAKIITKEQMHNSSVISLLLEEMTIKPVIGTKYVLDMMLEKKMIKPCDTQVVAEEYCAYIVYLFFEQNILNPEPNLDLIDEKMKRHNEFIVSCIEKKGNK